MRNPFQSLLCTIESKNNASGNARLQSRVLILCLAVSSIASIGWWVSVGHGLQRVWAFDARFKQRKKWFMKFMRNGIALYIYSKKIIKQSWNVQFWTWGVSRFAHKSQTETPPVFLFAPNGHNAASSRHLNGWPAQTPFSKGTGRRILPWNTYVI